MRTSNKINFLFFLLLFNPFLLFEFTFLFFHTWNKSSSWHEKLAHLGEKTCLSMWHHRTNLVIPTSLPVQDNLGPCHKNPCDVDMCRSLSLCSNNPKLFYDFMWICLPFHFFPPIRLSDFFLHAYGGYGRIDPIPPGVNMLIWTWHYLRYFFSRYCLIPFPTNSNHIYSYTYKKQLMA
jgi:hypothetical protein